MRQIGLGGGKETKIKIAPNTTTLYILVYLLRFLGRYTEVFFSPST